MFISDGVSARDMVIRQQRHTNRLVCALQISPRAAPQLPQGLSHFSCFNDIQAY